ncbi:MAG: hypothetical protein Q8873_00625 [Bacillota bacterium]|nr:hypothetical protein [Bacillota bacterium]
MTKTEFNQKAINMLKGLSITKLIELWNLADKMELTEEVVKTRGWLMDALEAKNPEAFNKWIENCDTDDNLEHYFC